MDPQTRQHLRKALRNRRFAQIVLQSDEFGLDPPPYEWAIVVAFYAAVHFANAYLWERLRQEPRNHDERRNMVYMALRRMSLAYVHLAGLGWRGRYDPTYRPSRAEAERAIQTDLAAIERAVMAELGNPTV